MHAKDIYGFNYDGSWGTSGLDLWQHHQHGTMAKEVALGKRYFPGWNTARWWLSNEAFERGPDVFVENFDAGLGIFARHGIRVVPVVFNRWRDPTCDFGGVPLDHIVRNASSWTSRETLFVGKDPKSIAEGSIEWMHWRYLSRVVGAFANDDRIVAWDLCNEPLMGHYVDDAESPLRQDEVRWLGWVFDICKALGTRQPLTIGNYPGLKALELTEPISDVLSFHPYYWWNRPESIVGSKAKFEAFVDSCKEFADKIGKDLFASETVWGAVDDAQHVAIMHYTLGVLRDRGIGFIVAPVRINCPPEVTRFIFC